MSDSDATLRHPSNDAIMRLNAPGSKLLQGSGLGAPSNFLPWDSASRTLLRPHWHPPTRASSDLAVGRVSRGEDPRHTLHNRIALFAPPVAAVNPSGGGTTIIIPTSTSQRYLTQQQSPYHHGRAFLSFRKAGSGHAQRCDYHNKRKFFQRAQDTLQGVPRFFSDHPIGRTMTIDSTDSLDKQLPLRAAMVESLRTWSSTDRKASPLAGQGRHKPNRLHPRQLGIYEAAAPVVQPIQTEVASFINVVLDDGGTSVGNVLVPVESTIFNVDGYGPVTLDSYSPPAPTPANSRPTSRRHGQSHAAEQTMQPVPEPSQQDGSTAAASPSTQRPMTIQVPGSSSQLILSSPPTPLPPDPSSSTTSSSSSSTASESYFGSTTSRTPAASDTASAQITRAAFVPPGNSTTSYVTSSQTISGSTLVTTYPIIITPTTNSTSYSSSTSGAFLTTSNSLNQTSTSSISSTSTNLPSTTSLLPSTTSSSSISSSSASPSGTFFDTGEGGDVSPTGTAGGSPSSSPTATSGSGAGGTPSTPTLVGSVVGGLAGLALILILILFLLRRHKQGRRQRTISPPIPQSASTGPGATSGTMTERSSAAVPFASAAFFRRLRPGSGATATTTETTPSERGFQNLGGRKLESVLSSRGDGYGDVPFGAAGPSSARGPAPPSIPIITGAPGAVPGHSSPESLSGSSFYRDSQGFYGGPGQGQPRPEPASNSSSMFVGPGSPPQSPTQAPAGMPPGQEGIAVMRPGPARTPITTQGGLSPMRGPASRGTPPPQIPGTIQERPRDGLGRSHPSMDGSRGSRFAENI
ncbi:MAG: hypothetical protein Q9169_004908 [Polycauliona sp. 2 TL-2023]